MKTWESIESTIRFGKGGVRFGGENKKEHGSKIGLDSRDVIGSGEINGSEIRDNKCVKEKNYQKMSKSRKMIGFLDFLIFGARLAFTKLR